MAERSSICGLFKASSPSVGLIRFHRRFGSYPWVKLVGLSEVISTLHVCGRFPTVTVIEGLVRRNLDKAVAAITPIGNGLFESRHWDACNATQFADAKAGRPLLLEKAVIIAKAVEFACLELTRKFKTPAIDVWAHLQIHPSNCLIDGLDEWKACQVWPHRFREDELAFLDDLELQVRPYAQKLSLSGVELPADRGRGFDPDFDLDKLILKIMEGEAVTLRTASALTEVFRKRLGEGVGIRVLPARLSEMGLHTCCGLEGPFLGLTLPELESLRESAGLGSIGVRSPKAS
jgi:hypothetical protein